MQTLRVRHVPWSNPVGVGLRDAFRAELARERPAGTEQPGAPDDGAAIAAFLIAYELATGQPVGCGGLRVLGADRVAADYVYVLPYARWSGIAHAIADELATWARRHGSVLEGPGGSMLSSGALQPRTAQGSPAWTRDAALPTSA